MSQQKYEYRIAYNEKQLNKYAIEGFMAEKMVGQDNAVEGFIILMSRRPNET